MILPFPILSSFANIGKVDSHCDVMWEFFIDPKKGSGQEH